MEKSEEAGWMEKTGTVLTQTVLADAAGPQKDINNTGFISPFVYFLTL